MISAEYKDLKNFEKDLERFGVFVSENVFPDIATKFGRDVSKYGSLRSPFLTGNLSESHSFRIEQQRAYTEAIVFIEHNQNKIYLGYADEYGPIVHDFGAFGQGQPQPWWLDHVEPFAENKSLPTAMNDLAVAIERAFK